GLPTPYWLVRACVATDHPNIKSVTRAYDKTSSHERFRFFGHVELGSDVSREELLERYHVVLYAIGTATDKRLGIPGEDLVGSHAATEFVAWYNGHPDHAGLEVDLRARQVVVVGAGKGELDPLSAAALADADKTRTRNVEITAAYAARPRTGKPVVVRFHYLAAPLELLADERGHVRAVRIERNEILGADDGSLVARGTGVTEELPAQIVFRSIGYRGKPLAGIPFDERRGVIRNDGGRVVADDGMPCVGEYVSGWIKRGPSGVIGTNKKDAQDTVDKILEDAAAGRLNEPRRDDLDELIADRAVHAVDWSGWEAIDAAETAAGEASTPARP